MNLLDQNYMGVPGVWHRKGPRPGAHVCIGIATHGNETEGLATLQADVELVAGSLTLILCNPAAVAAGVRYVDSDMNRLPEGLLGEGVEVGRARQLLPILQTADVFVDLHSTPGPSEPMLIPLDDASRAFSYVRGANIPILIEGITEHQVGRPLASHAGGFRFGVELGQQGTQQARATALSVLRALLANLGLVQDFPGLSKFPKRYRVTHAVHFEDPTCQFLPQLLASKPADLRLGRAPYVTRGEIIAEGGRGKVMAPASGHLLFPRRGPSAQATEAAFIAYENAPYPAMVVDSIKGDTMVFGPDGRPWPAEIALPAYVLQRIAKHRETRRQGGFYSVDKRCNGGEDLYAVNCVGPDPKTYV